LVEENEALKGEVVEVSAQLESLRNVVTVYRDERADGGSHRISVIAREAMFRLLPESSQDSALCSSASSGQHRPMTRPIQRTAGRPGSSSTIIA